MLAALAAVAAFAWSVTDLWLHLPRTGLVFCALSCMTAGRLVATRRVSDDVGRKPGHAPALYRGLVCNGLALYLAYCITLAGNNILNYVRDPWLMTGIPLFPVVNGGLLLIYAVQRLILLVEHHGGLGSLHVLGGLLCVLEIVRPGAVLGYLAVAATTLRPRAALPTPSRTKWMKILLALLLVIFVTLVWRRFQEGLLTRETFAVAGGLTVRILAPVMLCFWLLRRTRLFARCTTWRGRLPARDRTP